MMGNFSNWDGWQYRDSWATTMRTTKFEIPFWNGSNVNRLLVIGEQGIGDEILFASALPEAMVRCYNVIYCCDGRLVDPLARSLPGLRTKSRYVDVRDDLLSGYDAFIPAADLFALFRNRKSDFPRKPFLKPDPNRVREFEEYRGRTGISWSGRHGHVDPLKFGLSSPVSLQYDKFHDDIDAPNIDLRNDIEGVIALCSVLGQVVTVPTSVWHFAAAVGTPTSVILADKGTEDGIVDEIDYHVPLGESPYWGKSVIYNSVKNWRDKNGL
jgi:hypothetical protein